LRHGSSVRGSREPDGSAQHEGDDHDADDERQPGEGDEVRGAAVHQPLAMIPMIPLTSRKTPMPPTTTQVVMRAGVGRDGGVLTSAP
jgi:hypothetical protein